MPILQHSNTPQETGFWCGPASTQIVLTGFGIDVAERDLALELGTTTNGTDWIGQISQVLKRRSGRPYITVEMPNDPPTRAQVDRLWDDIVRSIDGGNGVVANIVAPASNHPPGYPNYTIYHYFTVMGYEPNGRQVYVADPARFGGYADYWFSVEKLASMISPKGYSAAPTAATGAVETESWELIYDQLMGPR